MKPFPDDPCLQSLAELPLIPQNPADANAVRRRARSEFLRDEGAEPLFARLSVTWSRVVLPTILLTAGAAYAWSALTLMGRIYAGG